jgi:hypothetical protein
MVGQSNFQEFLRDIEPSETTKTISQSAHKTLRSFLKEHETFKEHHVETFLSGSYKRNTAIRPKTTEGETERPDIDIIVVTNHTLSDRPPEVIALLYNTLKGKYSDIRKQTRSVGITTSTVDMDVVPIIAPFETDGPLYIPDQKLNRWLVTNPPGHTEWTTEINKKFSGRYKPMVKLFKWWRRENPTISKRPKGFVLECIAAECMDLSVDRYPELFVGMFESIKSNYSTDILLGRVPYIQDPSVPENNVTDGMSFAEFEGFYNKIKNHAEIGRKAIIEDNEKRSLELWCKIFGDRFASSCNTSSLLAEAYVPSLSFANRPIQPKKPGGFA